MYNYKLIEIMTRERERELALKRYRLALAARLVDGGIAVAFHEGRFAPGLIRRSLRNATNLLGGLGFRSSRR